ncbi:LAFE_0E02388g1_1 [Lachancea fermentati]|uniref:LAFE_0E02388g1_1 n=1 Tax=Lachancea fermentati TaxID=4955 RepID=A0A1G4MCI0_LACFM|nr:LAFE_0E02388g1_1 [Lachancea fermentati]
MASTVNSSLQGDVHEYLFGIQFRQRFRSWLGSPSSSDERHESHKHAADVSYDTEELDTLLRLNGVGHRPCGRRPWSPMATQKCDVQDTSRQRIKMLRGRTRRRFSHLYHKLKISWQGVGSGVEAGVRGIVEVAPEPEDNNPVFFAEHWDSPSPMGTWCASKSSVPSKSPPASDISFISTSLDNNVAAVPSHSATFVDDTYIGTTAYCPIQRPAHSTNVLQVLEALCAFHAAPDIVHRQLLESSGNPRGYSAARTHIVSGLSLRLPCDPLARPSTRHLRCSARSLPENSL